MVRGWRSLLGMSASDFCVFSFQNIRRKRVFEKRQCRASEGGHTLRSGDLEMILA